MEFTHNLKILLLDNNSNIINDDFFLEEIKNILTNNNTHLLNWNGKKNSFSIKWNKINLNQLDRHFMGDLFSHPIYEMDSIILNHTEKTISQINSKYIIRFHISRICCDKICSTNSSGYV